MVYVKPVTATLPVLSTVTERAGLVPNAQVPKFSGFGPALTLGPPPPAPAWNSTAPISAGLDVVSARAFPKKSCGGAPLLVPPLTALEPAPIEYAPATTAFDPVASIDCAALLNNPRGP